MQRVPQGQGLKCKKGQNGWGGGDYRSKDWIHCYFISLSHLF